MNIMAYQHICAPNDRHGNPRRCWVGYRPNGLIAIVTDENYSGRPAWTKGIVELIPVHVSASEYRSFIAAGKALTCNT